MSERLAPQRPRFVKFMSSPASDPQKIAEHARDLAPADPSPGFALPLGWQRVLDCIAAGDLSAADRAAEAIDDATVASRDWQRWIQNLIQAEDWEMARLALRRAMRAGAPSRTLRHQYALVLDRCGAVHEAQLELERLVEEAMDSPQLVAHLASVLTHEGRSRDAEKKLIAGLERWPADPQLHTALAQLRWMLGDVDYATARLRKAIRELPAELHLRLVAADVLRKGGLPEQALEVLEVGLRMAPESAGLLTSIGVVLDDLGRPQQALQYLYQAVHSAPDSAVVRRNLVPSLLRLGRGEEALQRCEELLRAAPDDQQLIAYRATALRLLGSPAYGQLYDYDRLVRCYRPRPPAGYASIHEFNRVLAGRLSLLHRQDRRPLDQSLRGGTQTQRNLPLSDPAIAAFFAMVDEGIRDYIAALRGASDHPTDRRRSSRYRVAGSWSVELQPGGFHVNHVHPMGWLSSAYYVEVPQELADPVSRGGWLKFGEPGFTVPGCDPEHFVQPQAGLLVLFPSCLWHGTVPFAAGQRRLTIAFDAIAC